MSVDCIVILSPYSFGFGFISDRVYSPTLNAVGRMFRFQLTWLNIEIVFHTKEV